MKFEEVKEKSSSDLDQLESKLKKELSELRLQAQSGQLAQTTKIGSVRRDIARVLTARKMKGARS